MTWQGILFYRCPRLFANALLRSGKQKEKCSLNRNTPFARLPAVWQTTGVTNAYKRTRYIAASRETDLTQQKSLSHPTFSDLLLSRKQGG